MNSEILLEGLNDGDINSLLQKAIELRGIRKQVEEIDDMVKNKIRLYLKERGWNNYKDDNAKVSVSVTTMQRETFDKQQLKMILSESQYAQVAKITTYDKVNILTIDDRERLNKYARTQKKVDR